MKIEKENTIIPPKRQSYANGYTGKAVFNTYRRLEIPKEITDYKWCMACTLSYMDNPDKTFKKCVDPKHEFFHAIDFSDLHHHLHKVKTDKHRKFWKGYFVGVSIMAIVSIIFYQFIR